MLWLIVIALAYHCNNLMFKKIVAFWPQKLVEDWEAFRLSLYFFVYFC